MSHFVCTGGCEGFSEKPLSCQMKSCAKHGMPLVQCSCSDNVHKEAYRVSPKQVSP